MEHHLRRTSTALWPGVTACLWMSSTGMWPRGTVAAGQKKGGRVIGEFTCKKITGITHVGETGSWEPASLYVMAPGSYYKPADELLEAACMSKETAEKYLKGRDGCGWHISDLKVYDNPKPLSGFSKHGFSSLFGTNVCGNESCEYYEPSGDRMVPPTCGLNGHCILHRAPQSWCYVEELKDETILPVLLQRLSE